MNFKRSLFCLLSVLLVPAFSIAEQEVKLKAGTMLTGKAETAGDKVELVDTTSCTILKFNH